MAIAAHTLVNLIYQQYNSAPSIPSLITCVFSKTE